MELITIGFTISATALAVLLYTGNLIPDSKKTQDKRLGTTEKSKNKIEENSYHKANEYIRKYGWMAFFLGLIVSLVGSIFK